MKFSDALQKLSPLEDYSVKIRLQSGEELTIENIDWKKASLQLLQNHLWEDEETSRAFDLTQFCEFYDEWKNDPEWHHTSIAFLDRYNKQGWKMIRK